MKNKIIVIISGLIILISVILIVCNSLESNETSVSGNSTSITDDSINIPNDININKNSEIDAYDKQFIDDANISNSSVYSVIVYGSDEESAGNIYMDIIRDISNIEVDRYWIVTIDDLSETLYWYDTAGVLQQYYISY